MVYVISQKSLIKQDDYKTQLRTWANQRISFLYNYFNLRTIKYSIETFNVKIQIYEAWHVVSWRGCMYIIKYA